jgi:hypothetical protein
MGLKIQIKGITGTTNYDVFYYSGNTPGPNPSTDDWGQLLLSGQTSSTLDIEFINGVTPIYGKIVDSDPYGKQYWFKILDKISGSYIVENLYVHEGIFYYPCFCCLSGYADSIPNPSPSPTQTPTPTPTPEATSVPLEIPGEPAACSEGMDVVFLVDYTGSMGSAINGVKTTISSIVNTIVTESNNNYRLGLVIYDEYTNGTTSTYSSHPEYTSLPSNQKYINTGINGKYQWITSLQKMSTNNQSDFTNKLNLLNNSSGGGWAIGNGQGGPEPADIGVDVIATNDVTGYEYIGGEFRTGVSKLIILITDNSPSGNDDIYSQIDIDYIDTLIPKLVNQNIRVLLMTTYSETALNTLAIETNGLVNIGFTGDDIITAIEDICV